MVVAVIPRNGDPILVGVNTTRERGIVGFVSDLRLIVSRTSPKITANTAVIQTLQMYERYTLEQTDEAQREHLDSENQN